MNPQPCELNTDNGTVTLALVRTSERTLAACLLRIESGPEHLAITLNNDQVEELRRWLGPAAPEPPEAVVPEQVVIKVRRIVRRYHDDLAFYNRTALLVAEAFGIPAASLASKSKKQPLPPARWVVGQLLREKGLSTVTIGALMKKHHAIFVVGSQALRAQVRAGTLVAARVNGEKPVTVAALLEHVRQRLNQPAGAEASGGDYI